ncbi:histone-like protein 18C [Drosophila biarmipes]|uniref:histone-like protein 18C n=1 Tax=Drosophila biarmipes TaxID=125945 RepID=UPI0007E7ADBC|nr:histone-like protein 18C [Drosophila biarmipes]
MSTLELNASEQGVGSPKPRTASEESIGDVGSPSDNFDDFDGCDILAAQGKDTTSGYINFLRDFISRYGDLYTCQALTIKAKERWNNMSFRHRCDYSVDPVKIVCRRDDDGSESSISNYLDSEEKRVEAFAPVDNFFGARNVTGGSDNMCPKKRAPKCGKPKKSCAKPRRMKSCAKPKPKCRAACPKRRTKAACARPRKSCPAAKQRCPKPKPRCSKPKQTCPM